MDIIKSIEHEQLKNKIPVLNIGDTVRVHVKIKEGNKERIQVFEGIIIKKQGGGVNATFTVRRISYGVGVEKTFLVHSPMVVKIEVVRVGKARRAKLYYLRDRVGKAAKTKEKIGARIETKEVVLKEEIVPGENEEVEEVTAEEVAEAVEADKAIKAEEAKAEEAKAKAEEPAKEEVKAEEPAKEEAKVEEPAVEEVKAEEPAVEEAKAEEPVEESKTEEPAEEEKKEDKE